MIESDRRGFRAPGTTFMVAGSLIGAVGAYIFQAYGGNELGTEAFAPIAQLWTVFFILATVLLVPLEQYVTREVASGRKALPHDLKPAAVMAGIGAVVGGGFVALTLDRLFEGNWQYVLQIVLLLFGYALLFVGKGILAGRRRFADVGWVLVIESMVRLGAAVLVIGLVADAVSLGWAMVIGGFSILAMRWWRHDSGDEGVPAAPSFRFLGGYVGATTSSQLLLSAAPIAAAALGASPALVSVVFVTFTLFRAPLTLIFALQGRVLPYLVGIAGSGDRAGLARIAGIVMVGGGMLAALGGLVGWLVGPDVVTLLFDPEFAPTPTVAALAAAGVMAAATAQIAGQVLVAEGRTSRMSAAWIAGLGVAVISLLLLSGTPDVRVALAFVIGEGVALVLMAVLAIRS